MPYRLEPDRPLDDELRRVVTECLDEALRRLAALRNGGSTDPIEVAVHEIRKRCKEARGLGRLVRPVLGDAWAGFNAEVRDAAKELSTIRDAHALLGTIEDLTASVPATHADRLDAVRGHQEVLAAAATRGLDGADRRLALASGRLELARAMSQTWRLPDDVSAVAGGVHRTYRDGRAAWKAAGKDPGDEPVHEWRKRVKDLWYQTRLLEPADPDDLGTLVADLDDLSDLLGHDHDLAVLVEHLERAAGTDSMVDVDVDAAIELARGRQAGVRAEAFDLGGRLYEPKPKAFVARLAEPWTAAVAARAVRSGVATIERERKFLVAELPDLPDEGTHIRQGYLALDETVSVRVRDRAGKGRTLTVKGGSGRARTELEWEVAPEQFDAAWPLTEGRRIEKTRYVLPVEGGEAELDIFEGDLLGLVLVEVEFDSDDAMAGFDPPAWFGTEVTDDRRYTNAGLALDGLAPDMVARPET